MPFSDRDLEEGPIKIHRDAGDFTAAFLTLTLYSFGCTLVAAEPLEVANPNSHEHVQSGTDLALEGSDENISSDSPSITIQSL